MTCPCEKTPCSGSNPNRVLELIKECDPVLFHKVERPANLGDETVTPPDTLPYKNVLLTYLANNHSYLYSSDGIPTFISMGDIDTAALEAAIAELKASLDTEVSERVEGDAAINEDLAKAEQAITAEATNREQADQGLQAQITDLSDTIGQQIDDLQGAVNGLDESVGALQSTTIQKNTSVSANDSTVTITKTTGELMAAGTETGLPLPVASETSAGVMNASTYQAVQENSENIDSILNGAVLIDNLPATPTQDELTLQWKAATGKTTLINRASIFDKANGKIWYYYSNTGAWESADIQNPEINVNIATNDTTGIVKGSTEDGQVAVEADGTMSLNGYDALTSDVSNLKNEMPKLPASMVYDFVSPAGANNPSTADNANITARVANTETGVVSNVTLMMPMASATQAGSVTAGEKTKLDNLLPINSLGDGLELSEDGVLSATGSDVNILTAYNDSPGATDAYAASYINRKINSIYFVAGLGSKVHTLSSASAGGIAIGHNPEAGVHAIAVGIGARAFNTISHGGYEIAIGEGADSVENWSSYNVAIGAFSQANNSNTSTAGYNVALGAFSYVTDNRKGEVSIGGYTGSNTAPPKTRFLANVRAGELDTDAVNLKQMNDAIAATVGDIDTALETLISGTGAN